MSKISEEIAGECSLQSSLRSEKRKLECDRENETPVESLQKRASLQKAHIHDLPPEVMTAIFMNLDSVVRKKIERVCSGWRNILHEVKKLRTHVHIQVPPEVNDVSQFSAYWCDALSHLVKADVEAILFDGGDIPRAPWELSNARSENGLQYILQTLSSMGADLSEVDITFSNWPLCCPIGESYKPLSKVPKKIRILRWNIMPLLPTVYPPVGAPVYFDELLLEISETMPRKLAEIFFSESGPMTEEQSEVLQDVQGLGYRFHVWVPQLRKICHSENWVDILMNIAGGGHVPKFTADVLSLFRHDDGDDYNPDDDYNAPDNDDDYYGEY